MQQFLLVGNENSVRTIKRKMKIIFAYVLSIYTPTLISIYMLQTGKRYKDSKAGRRGTRWEKVIFTLDLLGLKV